MSIATKLKINAVAFGIAALWMITCGEDPGAEWDAEISYIH